MDASRDHAPDADAGPGEAADLFGRAAVPLAVLDVAGRVLRVNDALGTLLGRDEASLHGTAFAELVPAGERAGVADAIAAVAAGDVPHAGASAGLACVVGPRRVAVGVGRALGIDGRPCYLLAHVVDVSATADAAPVCDDGLFRATFERSSVGLAHIDRDGTISRVNAACAALSGLAPDALVGMSAAAFTLPDDPDGERYERLRRAVADGELDAARFEQPVELGGRPSQVEVTLRALPGAEPSGILLAEVVDVTDRRTAERALADESARLTELVAFQRELASAATDLDRVAAMICRQLAGLAGGDGASVEVLDGDALVFVAEEGDRRHGVGFRLGFSSLAGRALRARETLVCADAEADTRVNQALIRRIGARSLVCVPVLDGSRGIGVLNALSGEPNAFDDVVVAHLEMLAALAAPSLARALALEADVYRDALTGLANRDRLLRRLDVRLASPPWTPTTAALVVLDIRGFAELNLLLGHDAGDRVLVEVARSLTTSAGPNELAARISSDRFALLLPEVASLDEARARAAAAVGAMPPTVETSAGDVSLAVAVGCAIAATTGVDGPLLLHEALDDLDRAKARRPAA